MVIKKQSQRAEEAKIILKNFKKQIRAEMIKQYKSIDRFCIESEIDSSIIHRLFSGTRPDIKVSTIYRIGKALKKKVEINLD